jgi:hypothetical protein
MKRKRDDLRHLGNLDQFPRLENYFDAEEFEKLIALIPLKSKQDGDRLEQVLPIYFARYLSTRASDVGTGLGIRRNKLTQIGQQAAKLRNLLLELEGPVRLDFLSTATGLTGSAFNIDSNRPDVWLREIVAPLIRDVEVVANKSEKQIKTLSKQGGRPHHTAERNLILSLAEVYYSCTKRQPGYPGYFQKFVTAIFEKLDRYRVNEGLNDVIKEVIQLYKSEL